ADRRLAVAQPRPFGSRGHAHRPNPRRRTARRPRLWLLRPPRPVPATRHPWRLPRPPEADHRFPPAPAARDLPQSPAGTEGPAQLTLAEAAGQARPTGRVLQAQGAASLADRGAVRAA